MLGRKNTRLVKGKVTQTHTDTAGGILIHPLQDSRTSGAWLQQSNAQAKQAGALLADVVPHFLLSFTSAQTQKSYASDLKEFLVFCHMHGYFLMAVHDCQESYITQWQQCLVHEKQLKVATVRRKLNALASFFHFCEQRRWIQANPMEHIPRAAAPTHRKTTAWSLDNAKTLLSFLKRQYQKSGLWCDHTQFVALCVLFGSGLRAAELCALRRQDVQIVGGIVQLAVISGKGQKNRVVPLHQGVGQELLSYLNTVEKKGAGVPGLVTITHAMPVFTLSRQRPLTLRTLYNMVRGAAQKAGLGHLSPHACRATMATLLHEQQVPLAFIQDLLGHKNLSTTSVYIHNSPHQLKHVALKCGF